MLHYRLRTVDGNSLMGIPKKVETRMSEHQIKHLQGAYERVGRCLHDCGQTIRYVEIDHEREGFRANCRACGEYPANASEVEDACD